MINLNSKKGILGFFFFLISSMISLHAQDKLIFYQDDIVKLILDKGGVSKSYNYKKLKDNDSFNISYRIFKLPKVYLGSENFTSEKRLLKEYTNKYLRKAIEEKNIDSDITQSEDHFKIVTEKSKNRLRYYYYHANAISYKTIYKIPGKIYNDDDNSGWLYFGLEDFIIEIKINDKLVVFKEYHLK